jgi:glycosyltransferase involved in cell wall biosynthesis
METMRSPRLTIGLPVYNGARFLAQTVRSLLGQSFPDFELIIGDNASTDQTGEIALGLAAADTRVRYVRNESNLGLAGNYNALLRRASGELFKWAPADDFYDPRYLEHCVAALDADPSAVLAYPRTQFVDAEGRALEIADPGWDLRSDDAAERLLYAIRANHWVNSIIGVIRRAALARTRLHPHHAGGDYVLLGELSLLGKFIEVPEVLFFRRIHPEASSQLGADRDRLTRLVSGAGGGLHWPTWQRTFGHLRTIATSPLSCRSRAKLLVELGRASRNRGRTLRGELILIVRWSLPRWIRGRV